MPIISDRRGPVTPTLSVGIAYLVVGKLFALPATHLQGWRLAAWIVSAALFAAHLAYENVRQRNSPRSVAAHTAAAVAIGAFLLAVAGMIYSLQIGQPRLKLWLLAFFLWPVFTAVPAFIVALVISLLIARLRLDRT